MIDTLLPDGVLPGWLWLAAWPWACLLAVVFFGGAIEDALQHDHPEEVDAAQPVEDKGGAEKSNPESLELTC